MSPLRRLQRELGVPAPLDDTAEASPHERPALRTPLTDALILSLFRAQTEKIDALTKRVKELELRQAV